MEPEYFYQEALRWNFGFENPNKGAVVFACLLPPLWLAWTCCWRIKHPAVKLLSLSASGILVLANCFCLLKTYSRGGVLAAFVALVYFLLCVACIHKAGIFSRLLRSNAFYGSAFLLGIVVVLFLWLGVGERSMDVVQGTDTSVGNRLILWRYALQMAAENPSGFGSGDSGDAYMQWYQPVEMTAGYRTMVNSYLTFLVEQGWAPFALWLLAFLFFWFWSSPNTNTQNLQLWMALRASILAFLVSGISSTVMEEPVLWIIPGACAVLLAFNSLKSISPRPLLRLVGSGVSALIICALLYGGGLWSSSADPIRRKFFNISHSGATVEVSPKNLLPVTEPWVIVPDTEVMGVTYGKLVRQLCLQARQVLQVSLAPPEPSNTSRMILVGNAIREYPGVGGPALILIFPPVVETELAGKVMSAIPKTLILLPEIDEDGRAAFWEKAAQESNIRIPRMVRIGGVGIRVDWGWNEVIQTVKTL